MQRWKYQIAILSEAGGAKFSFKELKREISTLVSELATVGSAQGVRLIDSIKFLRAKDILQDKWEAKLPLVGVYISDGLSNKSNIASAEKLVALQFVVLPVVKLEGALDHELPKLLKETNTFRLSRSSADDLRKIANIVLEALQLQREERRIFISYRRLDSSAAALQLYHRLDERGYRVFLDTHSLKPGVRFQDHLFHHLVDSDILVVLDTPKYLSSYWTKEELSQAFASSIGVLQVVWPGHLPDQVSALSMRLYLSRSKFLKSTKGRIGVRSELSSAALDKIAMTVELLRARSIGARYTNLVRAFATLAALNGFKVVIQPNRQIEITAKDGRKAVLHPAIGVPKSIAYHQGRTRSFGPLSKAPHYLLYDSQGMLKSWLTHLGWLDDFLPIKSRAISGAPGWIGALV